MKNKKTSKQTKPVNVALKTFQTGTFIYSDRYY